MHLTTHKFHRLTLAAFSALALLAGSILATALPVHAATGTNNPLVVVVRDTTDSTKCTLSWAKNHVVYKTIHCPAGTELTSFHIPLSEALANGEPYVVLPARTAPLATQTRTRSEILALFATVSAQYHPNTPSASLDIASSPDSPPPPDTCTGSYDVTGQWYPFKLRTLETSEMDYQRCTSGKIKITLSWQVMSGPGVIYFWYQDKYAAANWFSGCLPVGNVWDSSSLYEEHNSGFDYEPFDDQSNLCEPYDNLSYINIGPAR